MSRKWNRYLEVRKLIKIKLNRWPGGVTHALTMSYDDGVTFDVRLAELFDAHGIRGTFHMNSNYDMETGDAIEQFCAKAGGRDDVWYATNIEIVDYINAMYALKFSADRALVRNVSPIDVYISVNGKPECIRANAVTRLEVD